MGSAALFLAAAFTGFVITAADSDVLWDWLITFMATLISVMGAVALFWYQRDKNDSERQEQLLTALSAEAQACLKALAEPPSEIVTIRGGRVIAKAVLTPLPTAVLDETVRSGLHEPQDTYNLIFMARQLEAHNSDVATALSMQAVEIKPEAFLRVLDRVKERQEVVSYSCRRLVEMLEAQGIRQPEPRP